MYTCISKSSAGGNKVYKWRSVLYLVYTITIQWRENSSLHSISPFPWACAHSPETQGGAPVLCGKSSKEIWKLLNVEVS